MDFSNWLAFDTETNGLEWMKDSRAYYIGWLRGDGTQSFTHRDQSLAVPADKASDLFAHNIKFDAHMLAREGFVVPWEKAHDTMVMSAVLRNAEQSRSLLALSMKYIGYDGKEDVEHDDYMKTHRLKAAEHHKIPLEIERPYTMKQLENTLCLAALWLPPIQQHFANLYALERQITRILFEMEERGIRVSRERLADARPRLTTIENECLALLRSFDEASDKMNPSSPKQLAEFFAARGLDLPSTSKGNPSTGKAALQRFSDDPAVKALMEWRAANKLRTTYVDGLTSSLTSAGLVHTNFSQTTAVTGRLASSNPNLQNVTKGEGLGAIIKKCFVPRDGYTNISFDYSGMELRALAGYTHDEVSRIAFEEGRDIHGEVATALFGRDYTDTQRTVTKGINFGIIYGLGLANLAKSLGVDLWEAQMFLDDYYKLFPGMRSFQNLLYRQLDSAGYVTDAFGKRYYVPPQHKYKALNYVVQGGCANICKQAMVNSTEAVKGTDAHLLLQIHDELIFEVPKGEEANLIPTIVEAMTSINLGDLSVPMAVDVEVWDGDWAHKVAWEEKE